MNKKYILLKLFSVGLLVLWGFVQPAFFERFLTDANFAFLILIYGYALFLDFFDFGIGKPVYASLRQKFIVRQTLTEDIQNALLAYVGAFLLMTVIFSGFVYMQSLFFSTSLHFSVLLILSANITLNVSFFHLRNIFFAIDEFYFYEILDICRKIANLLTISFLIFDNSYLVTSLSANACMLVLLWLLLQKIFRKYDFSLTDLWKKFRWQNIRSAFLIYRQDAGNAFLFNITVAVTHACCFFLLPYFVGNFEIIQFGLWYKLGYGGAMIVVTLTEITLHAITEAYLNKNSKKALRLFYRTVSLSVLSVSCIFAVLYIFQVPIFENWVNKSYLFNKMLMLTLFAYFICRCFQYVSYMLALSLGGSFQAISRASFVCMCLMLITSFLTLYFFRRLDLMLLANTIVFVLEAGWYFIICKEKFSYNYENES